MNKKETIRQKIGPVGEAILGSMAAVGVVSFFALFPGMAYVIAPFIKKKQHPRKQTIEKSVETLIRKGYVKKRFDKNGEVTLTLTQRGKWEAYIRFGSNDVLEKNWDGIWRVVVFDIPQDKNKLRKELRRAMSLFGFRMLQQSVWVYPYACDDFVSLLKSHLGVSHNVLYMKVSYIENDKHLRAEFKVSRN